MRGVQLYRENDVCSVVRGSLWCGLRSLREWICVACLPYPLHTVGHHVSSLPYTFTITILGEARPSSI